ncbi:MAG: GT-D fold domain-containing glycosyltransferase [Victivallaceae bacterium]|nr:GT-D fold domain-containing glycosyltransferase [Victivallaceae bacterium]
MFIFKKLKRIYYKLQCFFKNLCELANEPLDDRINGRLDNMGFEIANEWGKLKRPGIKTPEETIDALIDGSKSICRFGDGEFFLIDGYSIPFQKFDAELARRLKEVLQSEDDNIYIGLIYSFYYGEVSNFRNELKRFYRIWFPRYKKKIESLLNYKKQYFSAEFTLLYNYYINYDFESSYEKMKKIWSGRDITIICGRGVLDNMKNNIFDCAKSIEYIYFPAKNAFSCYAEILEQAHQIDIDRLIIIILGPTATVLAYDLAKDGYQALDLGHIAKSYDAYKNQITQNDQDVRNFFKPD